MRRKRGQGGETCRGRGFRFYEPDSNTNVDSSRQLPRHRADRDSELFPAALGSLKSPSPYMCTGLSREPTSAADNAELGSIIEEITVRMRHDPCKLRESFRLRRVSTS